MDPLELPLKDIHLPPDPGWWPPAVGWWLLAFSALAVLAIAALALWRRRQRTWERAAQAELKRLRARYLEDRDAATLLRGVSGLLRRALIAREGRREVAALEGDAWLAFLDGGDPARPFTQGAGRVLADGPYRPPASIAGVDGEALLTLCEQRLARSSAR